MVVHHLWKQTILHKQVLPRAERRGNGTKLTLKRTAEILILVEKLGTYTNPMIEFGSK